MLSKFKYTNANNARNFLLNWKHLISDLCIEQSSMPQVCFQVLTPTSNSDALQTNRVGLHEQAKARPFPSSLLHFPPPASAV